MVCSRSYLGPRIVWPKHFGVGPPFYRWDPEHPSVKASSWLSVPVFRIHVSISYKSRFQQSPIFSPPHRAGVFHTSWTLSLCAEATDLPPSNQSKKNRVLKRFNPHTPYRDYFTHLNYYEYVSTRNPSGVRPIHPHDITLFHTDSFKIENRTAFTISIN